MSLPARYCSQRGDQLTISAMLNWTATTAIAFFLAANLLGQTPAPSSAPTAKSSVAAAKSPAPSASATPSTEQIINSLGENDLQSAIALPKSKALFSLRKPAARQDRSFNSDRDPAFQGLIVALIDSDTAGSAEAVAADLRFYDKALLVGQASAGRAVEYSDLPLPSGKILRVASAEAVMADGQSLFPGGVKPDLPVEMSVADKRQIFRLSGEKGMTPFVYETERPHLIEAALIAGTNPELDISDAQRRSRAREKQPARDSVLQRALDVVTSLEIYQKR